MASFAEELLKKYNIPESERMSREPDYKELASALNPQIPEKTQSTVDDAKYQTTEPDSTSVLDESPTSKLDKYSELMNVLKSFKPQQSDPLLERIQKLSSEMEQNPLKLDEKSLEEAKRKDRLFQFLDSINKGLGYISAGRVGAKGIDVNPVITEGTPTEFTKGVEKAFERQRQERADKLKQLENLYKQKREESLDRYRQENLDIQRAYLGSSQEKSKEADERFQTSEERRREQQDLQRENAIQTVVNRFEGDSQIKKLKEQGLSFNEIDSLLNELDAGNEIALGALGTRMAKAMGEVGVLTDSDVKRYIQAQSVGRKALDVFSRSFKGTLSDLTEQEIIQVSDIMKIRAKNMKKDIANRYIKKAYESYGKKAGLSEAEIYDRFGMKPPQTATDEQVKQYMGLYPNLTKEQAKKILEDRLNK